jgi:hypothetical protein
MEMHQDLGTINTADIKMEMVHARPFLCNTEHIPKEHPMENTWVYLKPFWSKVDAVVVIFFFFH